MQAKTFVLSITPSSSATIPKNGLIVDPGGYWPESNLLKSGLDLSLRSFL